MTRSRLATAALVATAAVSCSRQEAAPPTTTRASPPPDPGIALMERRTAADPRDYLSATMLAELRLRRAAETGDAQEYRRAEAAARTALEREPAHVAAKVALARALLGEGRPDESRRIVSEILDAEPRQVGALETAFDVAFSVGDDRASQAYADRLLAVNEEPGTLCRMGRLAERRRDAAGAAALFRRAAREAEDLGGVPAEIAEYRRLEEHACAEAKEGSK